MKRQKKKPKAPKAAPAWFSVSADSPSPWASVRVPAEHIAAFERRWDSPLQEPTWHAFLVLESICREGLAGWDGWQRSDAWSLVKCVVAGDGVNTGIENCAPAALYSRPARARLYFQAILTDSFLVAVKQPERLHPPGLPAPPSTIDHLLPALRGAIFYAGAMYAAREILRRGEQQVGFYAALLELARRAEGFVPLFGHDRIERAIDTLARSASAETRRGLTGLPFGDQRQALDDLKGQAAITTAEEWGAIDPLELLARALDGHLNYAPHAIALDAIDDSRPTKRWRKRYAVGFDIEMFERRPETRQLGPDQVAEQGELIKRLQSDPILWRRLGEVLDAARPWEKRRTTDVELARRLGVDRDTVAKIRRRIEDDPLRP